MTNRTHRKDALNSAQIRVLIDDELSEIDGLSADINAIKELGMLLGESRDCRPLSLAHMLDVIADKSRGHLRNIQQLNEQLR